MPDRSQLPYLVSLIDDETKEVRQEVLRGFSNYGSSLEEDLLEFSEVLDSQKLELLKPFIESNRRKWLSEKWDLINFKNDNKEELELALSLITKYQSGTTHQIQLPNLLNQLSEEFREKFPYGTEIDLANFLFSYKKISGEKDDYYNPKNSNLVYVIMEKKGLPISLACIYILVGYRLSFEVEGCNFPGHFLARTILEGETVFVDCFNGGKILFKEDFQSATEDSYESIVDILNSKATNKIIIQRILNNLINAYKNSNDKINSDFFTSLLKNRSKY